MTPKEGRNTVTDGLRHGSNAAIRFLLGQNDDKLFTRKVMEDAYECVIQPQYPSRAGCYTIIERYGMRIPFHMLHQIATVALPRDLGAWREIPVAKAAFHFLRSLPALLIGRLLLDLEVGCLKDSGNLPRHLIYFYRPRP